MKNYFIDGRNFTDPASAHREIALSMHFPSHYGGNLDALWDMLMQITSDTLIVLTSSAKIHPSCIAVRDLFTEAEGENHLIKTILL